MFSDQSPAWRGWVGEGGVVVCRKIQPNRIQVYRRVNLAMHENHHLAIAAKF